MVDIALLALVFFGVGLYPLYKIRKRNKRYEPLVVREVSHIPQPPPTDAPSYRGITRGG